MKRISWILLIVITASLVNIIAFKAINQELERQKNQEIHEIWQCLSQTDNIKDIFDYIQDRNPKLTVREMADYVSYVFQLSDDYQNSKYPVTPWEILEISDIESKFELNAVGDCRERGPMQLLPKTWNDFYQKFGFRPTDFENWYCNMAVATYLYSQLKTMYHGDKIKAIGFYNGGHRWQQKAATWNHIRKYQRASRGIRAVVRE